MCAAMSINSGSAGAGSKSSFSSASVVEVTAIDQSGTTLDSGFFHSPSASSTAPPQPSPWVPHTSP